MRKLLLLLLVFNCYELAANAIDHRYQKAFKVQSLSLENGLSASVVNNIIQDTSGYIWIATESGLNRFNGYEFTVFEQNHRDPNSIHDNFVHSIAEEPGKGIWVGTQNGLTLFDFASGSFISQLDKNADLRTPIAALQIMSSGNLFIGSDNGLYQLNQKTQQIELFQTKDHFSIEDEIAALTVGGDTLYVATENCIYQINESSNIVQSLCHEALFNWLQGKNIYAMKIKGDHLWIGTSNGLARFDVSKKSLEFFNSDPQDKNSLSSNWIQALALDKQGDLWVGTAEGLNLYSYAENEFTQFLYQATDKDGLTSNDIYSLFVDSSGLIWLGTYAAGVNILDPTQTGFKHILTKADVEKFNGNNTIHGLAKDKSENLWLANYGEGLLKMDLMTGELEQPFTAKGRRQAEALEYAYSLLIDWQERLWIGTSQGLFVADLNQSELLSLSIFENNERLEFTDFVFQIYEDHQGMLWLATSQGLYQVISEEREAKQLKIELRARHPEIPNSYRDRSNRVSSLLETSDGNLWVGGTSGLLFYSRTNERWQHFEYQAENEQSLSNDDVQVLFEDSRGILWVGTGNGLNKVHRDADQNIYFERITKDEGLPNNTIYGILEDKDRQLWLSTNLGLVRYSGKAESMQAYRRNDGLSSDEFNTAAYFSDSDGLLFFGSINGVTVVDSSESIEERQQRILVLNELKIGQRNVQPYQINEKHFSVIINPEDDPTLKISVADIYFQKLQTQEYRYRLQGLNDVWVYLGKERTFILAGLAEGQYQLNVQSKVANEHWSESLTLSIEVQADFWSSRNLIYFIVLIVILSFIAYGLWLKKDYQKKMISAENRIKREKIRLQESKEQNEELHQGLEQKIDELSRVTKRLGESTQHLDSYQFREATSGFYRYSHLQRIMQMPGEASSLGEGGSDKQVDISLAASDIIAVLHLNQLNELNEAFGQLVTAEVIAHTANQIKKICPSDVNLAAICEDTFLLIGKDENRLLKWLLDFRQHFLSSHIAVANEARVQTGLSMSYMALEPDQKHSSLAILACCEALIQSHYKLNAGTESALLRVDLNRLASELEELIKVHSFDELFEKNILTDHFI